MIKKSLTISKNLQQEALEFLFKKRHGSIEELKTTIDEETIREFELVGFIKRGVANNEDTWKISESARTFYKSIYGNPSFFEKIKGYFCHYALGI